VPHLAGRYDKTQKPDMRGSWLAPRNVWSELGKVGVAPEADELPPAPLLPLNRKNFGPIAPDKIRLAVLKKAAAKASARIDFHERPTHFESGAGLAIIGADNGEIIAGGNFLVEAADRSGWFRVTPPAWPSAASFVALLSTGLWAGGAFVAGFITALTAGEDGVDSLILRYFNNDFSPALAALGRMHTGQDLGDLDTVAKALREGPAADPVLAALASYAYSRAGASGLLAELAARFASDHVPMPFDLALVARLPLWRGDAGLMTEFNGTQIPVAGVFPWLRQGWARAEDDRRDLVRRLAAFVVSGGDRGLAASPFTTFKSATGAAIAQLIAKGDL
jgi:hypothetical protein